MKKFSSEKYCFPKSFSLSNSVLWTAIASIALLCVIFAPSQNSLAATAPSVRKLAPNFALTDANGATVRLSDYKGRVVLLDFWATWCHGCKTEIPWYMEFENKYKSEGLAVIGVSMDADGWKSAKPFMAAKKMNYTVVIGNDKLAAKYSLKNMPLTLLINRDGRIADSHAGVVDKAVWETEIRALLHEKLRAAR